MWGVFSYYISLKRKLTLILIGTLLTVLIFYGGQIRLKIIDMTTPSHITENDKDEQIKTKIEQQFQWVNYLRYLKYRTNSTLRGEQNIVLLQLRVTLWRGGWEVFKDYPLTGCGFKCMDLIYSQYPDPTGTIQQLRGMHNNLYATSDGYGNIRFIYLDRDMDLFFWIIVQTNKIQKNNQSEEWVIYGSAASAIAFLVGGFFESNLYDSEVVMVLYFIMALPFSGPKTSPLLPSPPLG